jgi:hypothetical protein
LSFLIVAGKQKGSKFSCETNVHAAGASDDGSVSSDELEYDSWHRHLTYSNEEFGDFIAKHRAVLVTEKKKADTDRNIGNTVIEARRRRVLPEDRNCNYDAGRVQQEYRSSRSYGTPVPEPISEKHSAVQQQCYSGGELSQMVIHLTIKDVDENQRGEITLVKVAVPMGTV